MLGGGLLSGTVSGHTEAGDPQRTASRLQGDNLKHNIQIVSFLKKMAGDKGYTPSQLAIAWLLSCGEDIVPQIGMNHPSRLPENLTLLDISFSKDELAALDQAFAQGMILGDHYPAFVMEYLPR